jgi:hypothetical protein
MLTLLLAAAPAAWSQTMTTGDIVGSVTDSSGAVVPNATVTLKYVDTNETRTTISGTTGQYRFTLMQPGQYTVRAEATGLKSKTQQFNLLAGQASAINLVVEVHGTTEVVEVTAQTDILQTENANLTSGFNTQQLANLPVMGGDLTTMAFTVPGILVLPGGGASGNFNVNGIPGASALFTLNGADAMDPYLNINNSGASNNLLGANEVAEASVILNAYSADFGRMTGAQVNYIGKTGTNSFHGNLFHNFNDKIFNANDFFSNQVGLQQPRSDSHQFGGSFGGPIRKNRAFFFFNYESLQYALPTSGNVYIPSPQLQTYTLAHIPAATLPLYHDAFALWNGASGAKGAVPVINGGGAFQDGTNHMGCGSGTFWNAGIQAPGGGTFGKDVSCTYVFAENASQVNKESLITIRGDYNITNKHKLALRYNYDWGIQATGPSLINPILNQQSNQPSDQGQLTYTWVVSPTMTNNLIGSGSWYTAIFGYADLQKAVSLMPATWNVADFCCSQLGIATNMPQGRNVGQAQFVDDFTWMHGSHSIKGGVNYRFNKITDFTNNTRAYAGIYTFNDLTDFATGIINGTGLGSSFSQSFPNLMQVHLRMGSLGTYVQDEWKIRRNVTLTLGMRIEHTGNPACLDNCFARMNSQFGTAGYQGGASIPYNQTITTGLHNLYQSLETVVLEPRFGFAWNIDSKTVLRGGIGSFANLFSGSVASSVFRNAPSVFTPSVTFGEAGPANDPASSAYAAAAAAHTFVSQFSNGATLAGIQSALGKIPFSAPGYYSPPNNFVAPKTTEWSVELERTLDPHDVLAVTYNGNHGYDQAISNTSANFFLRLGSNGQNAYYGTQFGGLPTAAPDPRFLTVTQVLTAGYSNYDGMTVQIRHSRRWGFQGQLGWTWSHALGLASVYNPYNLHFGYGNESIDVRHAIVADLVWTQPHKFSNAVLQNVFGGWNLGVKMYDYTGRPFSSSDSRISAQINSGGGTSQTFLATVVDPHLQANCTAVHGTSDPPCFTVNQFMTYNTTTAAAKAGVPMQMDFGWTGPGVFRGPGYFDVDTNVTKRFSIKERAKLEIGAQFFNVMNHPNFGNPTASITSASLGTTSSTLAPPTSPYGSGQGAIVTGRVIVLTAKFSF